MVRERERERGEKTGVESSPYLRYASARPFACIYAYIPFNGRGAASLVSISDASYGYSLLDPLTLAYHSSLIEPFPRATLIHTCTP